MPPTQRRPDHPENSPAGQEARANAEEKDSASQQAAENMAKPLEQGFIGIEVDPTPNEHYSLQGVVDGKPTPETDPEYAEKVQRHIRSL